MSRSQLRERVALRITVAALLLLLSAVAMADPTVRVAGSHLELSQPLLFETHGGTLLPSDAPILDAIAGLLRQRTTMTIEIGAHTDSRGSEAFNLRVTDGVAQQVRMALIARGIGAHRLTAIGFGESRPIADDATEAGREANRRIELRVVHP